VSTNSSLFTAALLLFLAAATAQAQPDGWSSDPSLVVSIETQPADPLDGLWRLEGESEGERYAEPMRFEALPGGHYRYERGADQGAKETGEARLVGQRLITRETPPQDLSGLLVGFGEDLDSSFAPLRRAIYRLDRRPERQAPTEGDGWYYYPRSTQRGRERLSRFERTANNNAVTLLVDGEEFFSELRSALQAATHTIELQTFIFTDDSTGRSVARLLMEKARAGVEVRMLTDGIDSSLSRSLKDDLREAGVELIVSHGWGAGFVGSVKNVGQGFWGAIRSLFGGKPKPREKRGIFNHDHRKITVVDSEFAFIGGMNIAREYEDEWHDVHSKVEGGAVLELQALFYDRWKAAGGEADIPTHDPRLDALTYAPGRLDVDVVTTLPGLKTDIKKRYLKEINSSQDRILIECAYFLDDTIIGALKQKVEQGTKAVVIVPNDPKHDVKLVRDGFSWVQNDVVRSGIELYKYRGPMVHSKVAVFDGRVCTVGSANLDNLALTKLAEANLFVNDAEFTGIMERRVFDADIPASDRVRVEKTSWWQKVKGGVLHFFRSWL
jgi:cardiolipin synthase A/B